MLDAVGSTGYDVKKKQISNLLLNVEVLGLEI